MLFDYVVAHGIYTWISTVNLRHFRKILSDWVSTGGAAYISCNAMPGWASASPIRRIFQDLAGGNGVTWTIASARSAIEIFLADYDNQHAKQWWERLSNQSDSYLMHELGATHADALWSEELRAQMASAHLDYVGPAYLTEHFDKLMLDDSALERIKKAGSAGYGETAKDIALGRCFLSEIFSRGAPRLSPQQVMRVLGEMRVRYMVERPAANEEVKAQQFQTSLDTTIATLVQNALQDGPLTINELASRTEMPLKKTIQSALIMLATKKIEPLRSISEVANAIQGGGRFNAIARQRYNDGVPIPGVVSAPLGTVVFLTAEEMQKCFGANSEEAGNFLSGITM